MTAQYRGKDLLLAVSDKDNEKLLEMAAQNKSKKSPFSFKELITKLSVEDMDRMWLELNDLIMAKTESIFISNHPTSRKSKEHVNKKVCAEVSHLIHAAIDLAFAVFEQSLPASQGLLHMVVFLNRGIVEIPNSMDSVKNSIALLCEKMYHLNYLYQNNEDIIFNILIYLLQRSLSKKATKKDVKRVYALRSIFSKVIGLKEVNANELWDLFKQCCTSSLYLSMPEGIKVISHILTTDVDHVTEMHTAIKKRLPSCSLTQGSAYGKVYFEAWSLAVKIGAEPLKNELEMLCLQDIVLTTVKSRQKSLVQILRKLLAQFHSQKKELHVARMLYFLYHPIIWRYLKNPDGLVRVNTAQLFLDVFPLEDPDVKIVTTDLELNEQLLMIKDLLVDDFPVVRSASVIGLCIAMNVNWELFPEEMLKTYFTIIVNDLSCDSSSTEVRCAVVKGLKALLENPLTIPTLKIVLPKIKALFHDISDSVRIAFCQLLLRVKKLSGIKYYEVVPLEHLMARLEEDSVIAKQLVNLLHNSYFPKGEGPGVWLPRCMEMLKRDRAASRVFFQFVTNYIDLEVAAQFMIQAVKAIHFYVKSKVKSRKGVFLPNVSDKENCSRLNASAELVTTFEENVGFNDPDIVSGLLDAVSIMWLSSLHDLEKPQHKNILKIIVAKLAKCLADLSLYYKDTPVWQSVYYLSSFMPSHAIPSLASLCFVRLKALDPETAEHEDYITLLECLCNHNEASSVLFLLKEWILEGFKENLHSPPTKKRRTKDKGKELGQPILAIKMLSDMLDHRYCQKVMLTRHPDGLKDLLTLVDEIKCKVEQCEARVWSVNEGRFLTEMLYTLEKIAVLLHSEEKFNSVKFIEGLVTWVQEKLLKNIFLDSSLNCSSRSLNGTRRSSRTPKKLKVSPRVSVLENLTLAICKDLCVIMTDMTVIGYLNIKTLKFIKFAMKLITCGSGEYFLVYVSKLLWRHISYGIYLSMKEEGSILHIVPDCFSKIIQCLTDEEFLERIPVDDVKDIQYSLASSILLMQHQTELKELVSDITSLVTKSILNSILSCSITKWELFEKECSPFEKIPIPKSGSFLLSTVCIKPKLIVYFLQQLQKHLLKSGTDMQSWVACFVILINMGEMKNLSKNINKEMHLLVNKMESLLSKHYPVKQMEDELLEKSQNLSINDNEVANGKMDLDKEISFGEHCQSEYNKLKELLVQKANIT